MVHRTIAERISNAFNLVVSAFGIRTEKEPEYKLVLKDGLKSIRSYSGYVVVKTQQTGDMREKEKESFYKLFNYISGKNKAREKIPMTAPVLQAQGSQKIPMTAPVFQQAKDKGWEMAFILPKQYSLHNAPVPVDNSLTLDYVDPKLVGVIRYTGEISESRMKSLFAELKLWLEHEGYQAISDFRSARYDPPFTLPLLRRSEIHVDVVKR